MHKQGREVGAIPDPSLADSPRQTPPFVRLGGPCAAQEFHPSANNNEKDDQNDDKERVHWPLTNHVSPFAGPLAARQRLACGEGNHLSLM